MAEVDDAATDALIKLILMCERRYGHGNAADAARFVLVIKPRSGRKEIDYRTGIT
jgi:hypothetical protein